jgi:hypothetical protein
MTHRPFVYGALAPGRPNEHVLADVPGEWEPGTVRGTLLQEGWGAAEGYPGIVLDEHRSWERTGSATSQRIGGAGMQGRRLPGQRSDHAVGLNLRRVVLGFGLTAVARVEGNDKSSVALLREAAELETSTPKHAVTPGPTLPPTSFWETC